MVQLHAMVLGACSQLGPVLAGHWPCVLLQWLWLTWRPFSCLFTECQEVGVLIPFAGRGRQVLVSGSINPGLS